MTTALLEPTADGSVSRGVAPHRQRWALFDAARLLAAYAIVWLHTPRSVALESSTALGRFAVPFFTAGAVFLVWQSITRENQRTLVNYARTRFVRLYLPFLAWSIIYLLLKGTKRVVSPTEPNEFPGIEFLWVGGYYHLWFLPFLMVVTIAAFAIARWTIGNRRRETAVAVGSLFAGAAIAVAAQPLNPVAQLWWQALPAACWGMAVAVAYRRGGADRLQIPVAPWIGLMITVAGTAWVWYAGRNCLAENVAGLGFLLFALGRWDGNWVRQLAVFGPLAYGIYLAHLVFIKLGESLAARLHADPTPTLDAATFVMAAICSTVLAWLLSRHRATRWLVA